MKIKSEDLCVETINPVKPGGQQVGIMHREIKVTHIPSGLTASSIYERSQLKNKQIAVKMIEFGLKEIGWRIE